MITTQLPIRAIVESLHFGDKLFRTLRNVEPHHTPRGEINFLCGRDSVLLEARVDGSRCSIKCYTAPRPHLGQLCDTLAECNSDLIIHPTALPQELWVGDKYIDVATYPWVEGHSLDREIRRVIHNRDRELIGRLLREFCRLALELLEMPWRHGDLKCENIIVRGDGSMVLVDCDALYHPSLPPRSEAGTPPYVHPARGDAYDIHIDDYAIALIATSLAALEQDTTLATKEQPMVASPSEHLRPQIEALLAKQPTYLTLLEQIHGESYKITNLKEILLCTNHK